MSSDFDGDDSTLLVISVMGIPRYSARGLTQTLTPIGQSKQLARSINGALIDLSLSQFQKYASQITCTDQRAPAIDGIWPGQEVTVACAAEIPYPVGGSPSRPVAPDSEPHTEGNHVFYRPVLEMRVISFDVSFAEWQADYAWTIDLEEI